MMSRARRSSPSVQSSRCSVFTAVVNSAMLSAVPAAMALSLCSHHTASVVARRQRMLSASLG